eukprot:50833_1
MNLEFYYNSNGKKTGEVIVNNQSKKCIYVKDNRILQKHQIKFRRMIGTIAVFKYFKKCSHVLDTWKPYIILDTMVNIANICDIICYADTGTRWVYSAARLFELTSLIKYGVMVFMHSIVNWDSILLTERFWSKRDAMLLLGVDINDMYDTVQRKASFMCFQINPDSIHFVSEWLYHAMDRRIITDDVNVLNMANIENYHGNSPINLHYNVIYGCEETKTDLNATPYATDNLTSIFCCKY